MSNPKFPIRTLSEAIAATEDFTVEEVVSTLPDLVIPPDIQAGLLRAWDSSFAVQVLESWTPTSDAWTEFLKSSEDDAASLSFMLRVLTVKETRSYISTVGAICGHSRLTQLMVAFAAAKLSSSNPPASTLPAAPVPPPSSLNAGHHERTRKAVDLPQRPSNSPSTAPSNNPTASANPLSRNAPRGVSPARPLFPPEISERQPSPAPLPSTLLFPVADISHPEGANRATAQRTNDAVQSHSKEKHSKSPRQRRPQIPSRSPPPAAGERDMAPLSPRPNQQTRRHPTPHPSLPSSPSPSPSSHDESANRREADAYSRDDMESFDQGHGAQLAQDRGPLKHGESFTGQELKAFDEVHQTPEEQEMAIHYARSDSGLSMEDGQGVTGNHEEPQANGTDKEDVGSEDQTTDEDVSEGGIDQTLNPWAWSQKTNDAKVQLWDLEGLIHKDRLSTAAARTKWMYEARLGNMDEEDYTMRQGEETKAFMDIPPACRDAVGMVFYKDSKLDWEIRVFLAPPMYKYVLSKVDEEGAARNGDQAELKKLKEERTELLDSTMEKLFDRFPDCSPDHSLRQIKKYMGSKAVTKYRASFRNKFTSDAGRMKVDYLKSLGKDHPSSAKVSTSTMLEVLGRKRAHLAFQLWGSSDTGGKSLCDPEIAKGVEDWKRKHPKAKPMMVSRRRITIVHSVRYKLFQDQTKEVRERWTKRAKALHIPKTPEEEKCLVDAAFPYVLDLLALLAERGNMHFALFAAAKGSYNIPIVMQEFSREGQNIPAFLFTDDGLGTRVKPEYIAYARKRFDGDVEEAEIGVPGVDFEFEEEGVEEPGIESSAKDGATRQARSSKPRQTYVVPFQPDQSTVKTVPQMRKAISDWILSSIEKIHASRLTWDKITQAPHLYIDVERMPMDPDYPTQRLQLQRLSAMSELRVKAFFKFLIESYNGHLSADEAFYLKHESRHLNVPSPTAPEDPSIHHAAAAAAKTKVPPGKRTVTKPKGRRGGRIGESVLGTISEDEDLGDLAGLEEDNDAALLDQALARGVEKPTASSSRKAHKRRIESPPDSTSSTTGHSQTQVPITEGVSMRLNELESVTARSRPRPMSILNQGTDEVMHKRFVPGFVEDPVTWNKFKSTLAEWGRNMTFWNERIRSMPYSGTSGVHQDIQLPNGLHAAFSILQIWNVYQRPSNESDLTINTLSGLEKLQPHHHVITVIQEISNPLRTLPAAKHVYDELQVSEIAADTLFLQLESAVSNYIGEMVASEESILEANLDLLKALRITAFVGASGRIRDVGNVEYTRSRTSALTDRFVAVLAAIAFARYMKVVLTQVAQLYLEDAQDEDRRSMWKYLVLVWEIGCKSLARALVHRRSDTFSLQRLSPILPKNFREPLTYAFVERPWWTPGDEGAPGPLKILNKQALAIEPFFKMLEALPWTQLSFIERGQVLLLIILAAIQIETGRISSSINRFAEAPKPVSRRLAESLAKLATIIRESGEMGPIEDPIVIPLHDIATHIALWCSETHRSVKPTAEGVPDTQVDVERAPTPPPVDVSREGLLADSSNSQTCEPPDISHATASSVVPPEEEDPTLPRDASPSLHHAALDSKTNYNQPPSPFPTSKAAQTNDDLPSSAIPAVRSLDNPPLPPTKKRRVLEVPPVPSEGDATAGRTLRSATNKAAVASNRPSTSTASSSDDQGKAAAEGGRGPKTRSANRTSGPVKPAKASQTPTSSEKAKKSGRKVGKAKA
ncbi:hypothetical protein FS837_009775 [Tulasnella sp. UAMH 9824]|nr:hypothetical protein FS837_009775 [Tulasnella sp. UAMH 9824]